MGGSLLGQHYCEDENSVQSSEEATYCKALNECEHFARSVFWFMHGKQGECERTGRVLSRNHFDSWAVAHFPVLQNLASLSLSFKSKLSVTVQIPSRGAPARGWARLGRWHSTGSEGSSWRLGACVRVPIGPHASCGILTLRCSFSCIGSLQD